jgi:hypothetical protein
MTKWRGAFAAWSTQIHKYRTFSLDQLGLPCASTGVPGQPHVGYAQAAKRAESQAGVSGRYLRGRAGTTWPSTPDKPTHGRVENQGEIR